MERSETLDKLEEMFFDSVPFLERLAARYVGQEDAWHVLVGVWMDCARIAETKEIRSRMYLACAVKNQSLRYLRDEKRHQAASYDEDREGPNLIQETEDWLVLEAKLMSLDDRSRSVVLLTYEGLSKAEIADLLGTTRQTVANILQRVKNKLF